jgi:rod shape-determining protein MreB and related proteins
MPETKRSISLGRLFSADLGVDLGTANARVTSRRTGEVFSVPAVVARHRRTGEIWAVGQNAADLIARLPEAIEEVRPLKDGAIADYDGAMVLLRALLLHARNKLALRRPRIVLSVPCELTQVERRALVAAAKGAGAREVYLLAAPMAAALGAGIPSAERGGKLVIDIGAGTTDVAVVTLSGVVHARTMRVGGTRLDEAVRAWMKRKLDVEIGLTQARQLKEQLGCALPRQDHRDVCIDARDRITGALKVVRVKAEELREAMAPAVTALVEAVRTVVEETPAELSADIAANGIVLAGGGARLDGLAELLMRELRLPVAVAKDPMTAGVAGCGGCLDRIDLLRDLRLEAQARTTRMEMAA